MSTRASVSTPDAPQAIGPYSQAIRVGNTVYLAGQIPIDPRTNQLVTGTIEEQTRLVLENLKAVLAAGTPQGIVDRIAAEVGKIVREPAMNTKLQELGFVVEGRPPAETGAFLRSEVERWGSVIRTAKITVE